MMKKLYFSENIDCEYTFDPPYVVVLTSTQNLCLRANIKECIPM